MIDLSRAVWSNENLTENLSSDELEHEMKLKSNGNVGSKRDSDEGIDWDVVDSQKKKKWEYFNKNGNNENLIFNFLHTQC